MQVSAPYQGVVERLAARLITLDRPGPALRVGADGRTAAGKTRFSKALAAAITALGGAAERAELDGFHNPRTVRWAKGRMSAQGYYEDARDLAAVRRLLLDPLGPNGDGRFAAASFDLQTDKPLEPDWRIAPEGMIMVLDGSFLQRAALKGGFDVIIFLDVTQDVAIKRGAARDRAALGDQAETIYSERYAPAFDLYCAELDPVAEADAVVDLSDFAQPSIRFRPDGRLRG